MFIAEFGEFLIGGSEFLSHLAKMLGAFLLALPVGWDREHHERSAGMRTFPIVAVASCGFVLLSRQVLQGSPDAQARVLEGILVGVGFIGGGAILKGGDSVRGTATAASIWTTGAIGASVAYSRYEIAALLALINFATLRWMRYLKEKSGNRQQEE